MQDSGRQSDGTGADQALPEAERVPSFEDVVEAKKVLLRNHYITQTNPPRYAVYLGLVSVKLARRILLVVTMLLIVAMGIAATLGVWEVIRAIMVGKIVLTCFIVLATIGLLVASNYYLGPVKWMTLDEQQDYEAAS